MERAPISRLSFAAILLCFFLSGAAGLIYQVAWGKALGLIFGHTVYAIATVLAVFMGGLALGSALLGRWSERRSNPVALYGWIELSVAATGALSLVGLTGVRALYVATFHYVSGWTPALIGLRFVGAALVLFLPTFLMGGTLPILVNGLTRTSEELGARISRLYWVNTSGAVVGTLVAGFGLLPMFGLRRTVGAAVALNVLAGALALLIAHHIAAVRAAPPAEAERTDAAPALRETASRFLLICFAAVGATAIAYEVCWTRLLSAMLGSSTYAFTLMLAVFLFGIVAGSQVFEYWVRRGKQVTLGTFATTQTLTALAVLGFLVLFQYLPELVPPLLRVTHQTFRGLVLTQFIISGLAMLPTAVVFGFNFPVVTLLYAGRTDSSGQHAAAVGRAYAANTLGAILGATLAGFWLVRWLGAFKVVAFCAVANLLLALVLQLRRVPRSSPAVAVQAGLLVLVSYVAGSGTFYNRDLATFGTLVYWDLYNSRLTLAEAAATNDVVFAEDGLNASISVSRSEDYIGLRTNGKVDASNHDVLTQLMMGHLGGAFHPVPRRALVIGFGSGMSVSAIARYPEIERIDVVEIEPAVIRAAPHLESLNRGVLRDPRVRVILDDARNYLLTTRETYDLILSEPSNPWIAGVAALFTDEFYREARARLAPGGLFVQWVQAYSLYPQDLRMVLGTFASHFPQVTLWHGETPDFLLLGQTEAWPLALNRIRSLWNNPALRPDYERLGMTAPEGILAYHRLDDADLRKFVGQSALNTDDHTRLEYNAPRALLVEGVESTNNEEVWKRRGYAVPRDVRIENENAALLAAAVTLLNLEEYDDAEFYLQALAHAPLSPALEIARGQLDLWRNNFTEARAHFQMALNLDMRSLEAVRWLGETARKRLDYDSAELLFRQILARDPNYIPALENLVHMGRSQGRWEQVAAWQGRIIRLTPEPNPEEYAKLGEMLIHTGDAGNVELAEKCLAQALDGDPYLYSAHHTLAGLYRERKQWERARPHLEFIARFDPDIDAENYVALAEVYRQLGRQRDAEKTLRRARRIFPESEILRKAG